jgi:DNA-binding transcriptional regulator YiaG
LKYLHNRHSSGSRKPERAGKRGKYPRRLRITAEQFRDARVFGGLSRESAAALLGVSLRTVGHWETGQARPAFAAFKLLRILRHGEFADPRWAAFRIVRGKLVTPENHSIDPTEMTWLSLLVRRAAAFSELRLQRDAARLGERASACREGRGHVDSVPVLPAAGASVASAGLVYSSTSRTHCPEIRLAASFQGLEYGAMMGPQWGHDHDQARIQQAQSADAPDAPGAGRSSSVQHGPQPQRLLPVGAPELHSIHGAAGTEGAASAQGEACNKSDGEHLGKGRSERSVPLWQRSQSETVPSGSLLTAGGVR